MEQTIKTLVKGFGAECVKHCSEFYSAKTEWMEKFKIAEVYCAMAGAVDTPWEDTNNELFNEFIFPSHDIMCETSHQIYSKMQAALITHELFVHRLETAWNMVNDENNANKWHLSQHFINWVHEEWNHAAVELEEMADKLKDIDSLATREWGDEWLKEQGAEW